MSTKVLAFTNSLDKLRRHSQQSKSTKEVLREMFTLLEEYAPIWYPEDLHNRAVAALGGANSIG